MVSENTTVIVQSKYIIFELWLAIVIILSSSLYKCNIFSAPPITNFTVTHLYLSQHAWTLIFMITSF